MARCSGRPRTRCWSPTCTSKRRAGSRASASSCRPTTPTRRSTALAREVERSGATRLYCLGDSFHDRFGCDRLPAAARELLLRLTAALDWVWIVGNHDPGFADHCGGRLADEVERRRDRPAPRGGARRSAAGNVGPFPSQAAAAPERPQRLAPLLRRQRDQADPAGVRRADRRPRRPSSRRS